MKVHLSIKMSTKDKKREMIIKKRLMWNTDKISKERDRLILILYF